MSQDENTSRKEKLTVFEMLVIPELRNRYAEDNEWLSREHENPEFWNQYENRIIAVCDKRVIYAGKNHGEVVNWLGKNPRRGIVIVHYVIPRDVELLSA